MNRAPLALAAMLTAHSLTAATAREPVIVHDGADSRWSTAIAQTVDAFNAVMPPDGPALVYERDPQTSCDIDIAICSGDAGDYLAWTTWEPGDGYGAIMLTTSHDWAIGSEAVVCHELMHAVAHVTDNYGARPDSCVWGYLEQPGAFDIWLLDRRFEGATDPPLTPPHKPKSHPHHHTRGKPHHHHCARRAS